MFIMRTKARLAWVAIGGLREIVERLVGFVRLGFTGFNFLVGGPDRDGQVQRLAEEVIPAVRAGA